jgi:hypothetical protein
MIRKQWTLWTIVFAAIACLAAAAEAQTLNLTLLDPDASVTQGATSIAFDAIIANPSMSATIYLNGDSFTTSSPFLTVNDSPFDANAPVSLAPGQSSGEIELFDVDLSKTIPVGTYSGSNLFSILGGADGGSGTAFGDLADAKFSVTVSGATSVMAPEIDANSALNGLIFLVGCLVVLRGTRPDGESPLVRLTQSRPAKIGTLRDWRDLA